MGAAGGRWRQELGDKQWAAVGRGDSVMPRCRSAAVTCCAAWRPSQPALGPLLLNSTLHLLLTPLPILFQPVPPPAGIKANTRDGVLTVTVPKTEEPKPKSIDVSVE